MTPAARYSAAIEVITAFDTGKRPVDRILQHWFRSHRFAGSRDRREIRQLVYSYFRFCGRAIASVPEDSVRLRFAASRLISREETVETLIGMFLSGGYGPSPLDVDEIDILKHVESRRTELGAATEREFPAWLSDCLSEQWSDADFAQLDDRAPVDIRTNSLVGNREQLAALLRSKGMELEPTRISPLGLRLPYESRVTEDETFEDGWFEVQDEGSQIAGLIAANACGSPDLVVDYCAGAGGKALQVAALMNNKGRVIACDIDGERLGQLRLRSRRARAINIETVVLPIGRDSPELQEIRNQADLVIADVPCTGSGTWRRMPDAKWRLTRDRFDELCGLQRQILKQASEYVRPNGRLVYITCSQFGEENSDQVDWFLEQTTAFRLVDPELPWADLPLPNECDAIPAKGSGLQLSPVRTNTDGFFVAVMEKMA